MSFPVALIPGKHHGPACTQIARCQPAHIRMTKLDHHVIMHDKSVEGLARLVNMRRNMIPIMTLMAYAAIATYPANPRSAYAFAASSIGSDCAGGTKSKVPMHSG